MPKDLEIEPASMRLNQAPDYIQRAARHERTLVGNNQAVEVMDASVKPPKVYLILPDALQA